MEGDDDCKQLGDYFVVCGLPKNPKPYDLSPVLPDLEEILLSGVFGNRDGSDIHNLPVDFTHFPEPIVDIQLVTANTEELDGYTVIKQSFGKKGSARILGGIKREFLLCYRRGRDKPPITSISFSTESSTATCPPNSYKLTTTYGNEDADLSGFMETRTYLMFTRASRHFGIDELAVTDIVVVLKSKGEVCPPAYHELPRSLNANKIGHEPYLCYRKSLVKEHTIAYEPQVLKWYRFPSIVQSSSDCQQADVNDSCVDSTPVYSPFECTHPSTGEAEGDKYLHPDISQVANFCLPWGAALESWSVEQNPPHTNFFSFVLTNEAYQRLYGVAFTFHEPYNLKNMDLDKCYRLAVDPELLTLEPSLSSTVTASSPPMPLTPETQAQEQEIVARQRQFIHSRLGDRVVGVTKTICLLSRWSFSVAFTNLLGFLYSRCFLQSPHRSDAGVDESSIPIERYLQYFLCEVPFPDLRMPSVQVQFSATTILLQRQNETSASSSSCECFFHLLDILGVQLSIQLLLHMLTEQKVVITSVQPYRLAQLGEALTSVIFPLHWTVVYIPFIYMGCIHVIQSPSPFLIGVDTRFCDFFRLPPESGVTYVDVDNRNIVSGQPLFSEKMLPKDCLKRLEASLNSLDNEIRTYRSRRPVELSQASINVILERMFFADESEPLRDPTFTLQREWFEEVNLMTRIGARIKATFREFMANLLRNYRKCLVTVANADGEELFQAKEFLRKYTDKHTRPFYQAMLDTQQWANFIRDCSYLSPRYDELAEFNSLLDHSQQQQAPSSTSLVVAGGGGESNGHPPASSEHSGGSTGSTGHLRSLTLATSGSGGTGSSELSACCTAFQLTTSSQDLSLRPTRVISPPVWPLSDLPVIVSSRVRERPSFRISIRLLHSLVSSALHRMSASTTITTTTSDMISCSTCSSVVMEHLSGGCQVDGGELSARPSFSSLQQAATTKMTNSSSGRAGMGLTGLPTEFVLPVKNTVLLRRTPSELWQTNEFALRCSSAVSTSSGEADEESWAGYLVGSMYAMWFILLPSYLAAVYAIDTRLASAAVGAPVSRDLHEQAMASLNGELVNAIELMRRLTANPSDYVFLDQVCLRILLVLVYQNRPDSKHLKELLNGNWTSCSHCVFNHIYKAYQKEMQAAESVYQLPRKKGQQQKERNETRLRQQQPQPETASALQDSLSTGDMQQDALSECSTGNRAKENCQAEYQVDSLRSSVGPPACRLTTRVLPVARRTGDEIIGELWSAGGPASPVVIDKPVNAVEGKQGPLRGPDVGEEPETPYSLPPLHKVDGDTCGTPLRRVAPLASTDEFTGSATSTPLPPAERSPVSSRSSSSSSAPPVAPRGPISSSTEELAARAAPPSSISSASSPPGTAAVVARPTLRLGDLPPRPLPVRSRTTGDSVAIAGGSGQAVDDRRRELLPLPSPALTPQTQEREESLGEAGANKHPPSTDQTTGKLRPSWSLGQPPNHSPVPTDSPGTSWRTRLWSYDLLKRKMRDLLSPTSTAPTSRLYQQHYGHTPWTPQPQRLSSRNSVGVTATAADSIDDASVGCRTGADGRHLSLGGGGSSSSRIPRDMSRWSRKVTTEFARPSAPVPLASSQRGPQREQENGVVTEGSNVGLRSSEAVALNGIHRIGGGVPQPPGDWNIPSVRDTTAGGAAPSSPRWLAVAGPMAVGRLEDKWCASSLVWLMRNRRQAKAVAVAATAVEKTYPHPPDRRSPTAGLGPGTATLLPTVEATRKNSVPETAAAASGARLKSDLLVGDWPRVLRLRVTMTTCSRCSECGALMFDEEIMSAWHPTRAGYPDDMSARDPATQSAAYSGSSYSGCCTVPCGNCGQQLLPLLSVQIAGELTTEAARRLLSLHHDDQAFGAATATVGQPDYRPAAAEATRQDKPGSEHAVFPQSCTTPESDKSTHASPSKRTISLVPVELCQLTYPYRSPVLLRRDLEQVFQTEGDAFFRWPTAAVAGPMAPTTPSSDQRVSVSALAGGGGGGAQTNHLPVSLSSLPVLSSLFNRQPALAWNLIWCFHRLGLPTHLLDMLPTWLAEVQADLRKSTAACPPRDCNEAFFDELRGCWNLLTMLHVDFYTPRPSVRLYSYWMPFEVRHEALYQQLLRWFREYTSSEMLVPHGQRLHPGSLGLRRDSNCPVEVAITAAIDAWKENRLGDAVRSLVMLRAQANQYGPEVMHRSQPVRSPAHQQEHKQEQAEQEHRQGHHLDARAEHTCSWTLSSNIYRELGFLLAVQQQQSATFDFDSFDEKYLSVCHRMLQDGIQLMEHDRPPGRLAARYRSLLRRLSLD